MRDAVSRYSHVFVARDEGTLHVQVPPTSGAGWTDEELLALADAITVVGGAAVTVG